MVIVDVNNATLSPTFLLAYPMGMADHLPQAFLLFDIWRIPVFINAQVFVIVQTQEKTRIKVEYLSACNNNSQWLMD